MANLTKEQLKEYLKGKWDITFEYIVKDLKISEEDYTEVRKFLEQLKDEGWIFKSFCSEHKTYEYDLELNKNSEKNNKCLNF